MKAIYTKSFLVFLALAATPSCTAKYQRLLHERDLKIKELYAQAAELAATNQDLDSRYQGARSRAKTLEERLASREQGGGESGLESLKSKLGPDVDVRVDRNRLALSINNKVTFNPGSTALKGSAGAVLSRVAAVLKKEFPNNSIIVEGHTDPDPLRRTKGKFRSNRHLSLERADAVADYLVKKCGIGAAQVVVAGFGPHKPLQPGSSASAKAANRRVEIVVGTLD